MFGVVYEAKHPTVVVFKRLTFLRVHNEVPTDPWPCLIGDYYSSWIEGVCNG